MKVPFKPMLATLVPEVPSGEHWDFEAKYDGIRVIAARREGRVRLYSRNLKDRTSDFEEIARDLAGLPGGDLLLDGEIVALDRSGVSRFQLLQRRGAGGVTPRFAVFDLLQRDGRLLLRVPLAKRREALSDVVPRRRGRLLTARRLHRDGRRAYAFAKRMGWEGVIAKDDRSLYEPGVRSRAWLKVKVREESEFVIGGYTAPAGARLHLGALLVGLYDRDRLRYVGKVGTGFSGESLRMLARKFKLLRSTEPPFDPAPSVSGATWVKPRLVAQLAFGEWTADGKLRQPAFLGLRDDKSAKECRWSEREK